MSEWRVGTAGRETLAKTQPSAWSFPSCSCQHQTDSSAIVFNFCRRNAGAVRFGLRLKHHGHHFGVKTMKQVLGMGAAILGFLAAALTFLQSLGPLSSHSSQPDTVHPKTTTAHPSKGYGDAPKEPCRPTCPR